MKNIVKPDNSQALVAPAVPLQAVAAGQHDIIESSHSVGELLRRAREQAGLSLGDVASKLRMGIKQVRALEQDDYSTLPTGTFLRGFVRNFAKEVAISPEEALRLLGETHRSAAPVNASVIIMPSQQNISVSTTDGAFATPRMRAFFTVLIATLLLAAGWYYWEYVWPHRAKGGRSKAVIEDTAVGEPITLLPPSLNIPIASNSVSQQKILTPPQNELDALASVAGETPAGMALPSRESAEVAPAVPRPTLPAGTGLLGFTFTGESWVEVIDQTGKIVLDRKFKNGEAEEVIGRPPFSVVIGNAKATRMAYDGKEVDLVPYTRVSVARVTVK